MGTPSLRWNNFVPGIIWLLVGFGCVLQSISPQAQAAVERGCLKCHAGIEPIGAGHDDISCTDCHYGNDKAKDKDKAHAQMYRNPGDLNIVEETCGLCHEDELSRVKESLHATSAGIISGARYLWAAQEHKNGIYSVRDVKKMIEPFPSKPAQWNR